MSGKTTVKLVIDFLMYVIILVLMSYMITGQKLHEWLGAGVFILFLLHNILNYKWYASLFKGKYSAVRTTKTITNAVILVTFLILIVSGIVMSLYVFPFAALKRYTAVARKLHLSLSHLIFILMSLHFGMHWSTVMGVFRKIFFKGNRSSVRTMILRIISVTAAIYGIFRFIELDFISYISMKVQFAFFDIGQPSVLFYLDYLVVSILFVFIGHYFTKFISFKPKTGKLQIHKS